MGNRLVLWNPRWVWGGFLLSLFWLTGPCYAQKRPNVILILTDDQGYGDLGCHGNPWVKTPSLDQLHAQSIRFTNFHTGTTCTPTRAGLMSGKNNNRVGAWHTIMGRSFLRLGELTMADYFKTAGYQTAILGKWHLGDNYPYRPQDRGFDEAFIHGGGGIGQTPDYWGNDYFDDTYFRNGKPEQATGYCTDVWFKEAKAFIGRNKNNPFLLYLALNAPHAPYRVPETYLKAYQGNPAILNPAFLGMITKIDEQVGLLRDWLKREKLDQNTILLFMSDNGTAAGATVNTSGRVTKGYNANMRGLKGSPYDGGHRVPLFLHWPRGGYVNGRDVTSLCSYTDLLPTLLDLCQIPVPGRANFDGISLRPYLDGKGLPANERIIITDTQRSDQLIKGKQAAIMTDQWRLVNQTELYDIRQDPSQERNVATEHPEVVKKLLAAYEEWWAKVAEGSTDYNRIPIGPGKPVLLTAHDGHVSAGYPAWNQEMVRSGEGENGFWAVDVTKDGAYQFCLFRYPPESGLALQAGAPATSFFGAGQKIAIKKARIKVGTTIREVAVQAEKLSTTLSLRLPVGPTTVSAEFMDDMGKTYPVYYVKVQP